MAYNYRNKKYNRYQQKATKKGRMVKPYNEYWNKKDQKALDWSTGIVGTIVTILAIISIVSKPTINIEGHTFYLTQNIVIPAILISTMIWSLLELFTRKAKHWYDVIVKVVIAYIIGYVIGGFIGYQAHFAQLILQPAYNGNIYAIYNLISILVFVIMLVWANIWMHKRTMIRTR